MTSKLTSILENFSEIELLLWLYPMDHFLLHHFAMYILLHEFAMMRQKLSWMQRHIA